MPRNYKRMSMMNPYQLTGVGPNNSTTLTLDNFRTPGGQVFKDVVAERRYDTVRFQAGQAINQTPILFFQKKVGDQVAGGNFAGTYPVGDIDTNMTAPGQLGKGEFFRIRSMQVRLSTTGATDTTYGSSGASTQMPTAPAGAATISAVNELKMILEGATVEFKISNRPFEKGKLIHFPSPYGFSGFAGGGIPGTANTDTVAVVNNGFGREFRFPFIRNLDGLRTFSVVLQFGYIFTPTRNFNIEVLLEGLLYRSLL